MKARAASPDDAAAIARIYNEGIEDRTATFEVRPRSEDEIRVWFDGVHPIVAVEDDGNVIAFAATFSYRPRECYAGIAETSVYVSRRARGRGAGRTALCALLEASEKAGFWKLVSRVFPENEPSRRLIRSLGFREVGVYEKHGRLDGVWRDVVIVERLIRTLFIALLFVAVGSAQTQRPKVRSHVTLIDVEGKFREVIYEAPRLLEAPNWSRDGRYLLLNSEGRLWKVPIDSLSDPQPVPTGAVNRINNDHGISPDGKWFAISAGHIYLVPAAGGEPRQITSETPSYYHGWSPDGSTLAYCARRADNFDLYAISRDGGPERRLTTDAGYDDGPDYTPDGRWIYFNSDRSGSWDIWRIPAQGAGPNDARAERITSDDWEDWFPHPSPDGKWIVFLSFEKGTKGHPANQNVVLRRMPLASGPIVTLTKLFGGQGTLNVNSWAPDSKRFAFVRYSLME